MRYDVPIKTSGYENPDINIGWNEESGICAGVLLPSSDYHGSQETIPLNLPQDID